MSGEVQDTEVPRTPATSLVVGATGATGRLLVVELLARGGRVRALVRRAETLALALIRRLVPPHADDEEASDVLRTGVGRSAIFDAGQTSRVHVARFMAELMTGAEVWHRWKGRMPVVYDEGWDARASSR